MQRILVVLVMEGIWCDLELNVGFFVWMEFETTVRCFILAAKILDVEWIIGSSVGIREELLGLEFEQILAVLVVDRKGLDFE